MCVCVFIGALTPLSFAATEDFAPLPPRQNMFPMPQRKHNHRCPPSPAGLRRPPHQHGPCTPPAQQALTVAPPVALEEAALCLWLMRAAGLWLVGGVATSTGGRIIQRGCGANLTGRLLPVTSRATG